VPRPSSIAAYAVSSEVAPEPSQSVVFWGIRSMRTKSLKISLSRSLERSSDQSREKVGVVRRTDQEHSPGIRLGLALGAFGNFNSYCNAFTYCVFLTSSNDRLRFEKASFWKGKIEGCHDDGAVAPFPLSVASSSFSSSCIPAGQRQPW
jgi:hypothetical protein